MRDHLGTFVDFGDGQGPRFLLSDEEIEWVNKHFHLLQQIRDKFVSKVSIKSNVSPERLQQRERENSQEGKFKP